MFADFQGFPCQMFTAIDQLNRFLGAASFAGISSLVINELGRSSSGVTGTCHGFVRPWLKILGIAQ